MFGLLRSQPRAFHMVFMLEIWERFGYYTVQGILTLYFIRALGFDDVQAYYTFGAFSALVYGMVAIGGYLGDKVLGVKRTIILGLSTLALGYLSLALADKSHIFLALGLISVGNGVFKANPANLLSKAYEENDPRLHGGFTLYYMAINLGSIFALFVGPYLSTHYGYPYAYFMSFIGLLLGLANYWFQRAHIKSLTFGADKLPVPLYRWALVIVGMAILTGIGSYLLQHAVLARNLIWLVTAIAVAIYIKQLRKEQGLAYRRMILALILMIEGILFFTLYQQMPTSLTLFAVHNVRPYIFGIPIDPQSFQVLNPVWIIAMGPVLAMLYNKLNQRGINFSIPYKFSAGMLCCGISFLLLYFSKFLHDEAGMVSSWWLIASYCFQSLGELLVSALGVAMVAELVPLRMTGFVMGMWFLNSSIAGFFGATVASFTALPKNLSPGLASLNIYTSVFAGIGLVVLLISLLMWIFSGFLSRYVSGKRH